MALREADETASGKVTYFDLEESTYKANNKFEIIALLSCAVSLFEVGDTGLTSLVSLTGVPQYFLECVLSIGALGLFINYRLRLKDEGKVAAALTEQSDKLREVASGAIQKAIESLSDLKVATQFDTLVNAASNAKQQVSDIQSVSLKDIRENSIKLIADAKKAKLEEDEMYRVELEAKIQADEHGSYLPMTESVANRSAREHYNYLIKKRDTRS